MLSRVTGLLRDVSLAYAFGTESAIAALLVAFRFAHLLRRLLGEGAMQTALIPHFEELRKSSKERAARFFCDLTLSLTILLVILIAVIMLVLWWILNLNIFNTGNNEIIWLTFLMMPSLLFICLFGINASLMQCEKIYFVSSAAPIVFNLVWIIGIFCTSDLPSTDAMTFLSIFIGVACLAQWAVTIPKTYSIISKCGVTSILRQLQCYSIDVRKLAKPLALGIIGIAASQVNNALDSIFARWADDQGPALLWYAIRLQQLPLAIFGIALSGALLPPLSRAIKANDTHQFQHFLDFAFRRIMALMIPITFALFIMGDLCVSLIYGHGDFSTASIVGTTQSLWGYTAGLVPMALILVLAPAFYAKGDFRTPSIAAVASMLMNVLLNGLLVGGFGLGAASIAIATSISAWFNLIYLGIQLTKVAPDGAPWNLFHWPRHAMNFTLASIVAAIAVITLDNGLWNTFTPYEIILGEFPTYTASFFTQAIHLSLDGIIFLGVLGLIAYLFKLRDITHFAKA